VNVVLSSNALQNAVVFAPNWALSPHLVGEKLAPNLFSCNVREKKKKWAGPQCG
jgi:hypothetical protein